MKKKGFHTFILNSFTFTHLSHVRVEEGQEPVNLTGGPLAYKYQFQEMFFHWGQKVLMLMLMLIMLEVVRRIMVVIVLHCAL